MSLRRKDEMIDALLAEMEQRKEYLSNKKIDTLYIGGGTPSLLSVEELGSLVSGVSKYWDISNLKEFTIETNPEDLSEEYLKDLLSLGVNRLSIGVQSFVDEHLKFMNRRHDAERALRCVKDAQKVGFKNISIDLIYGIPKLTDEQWRETLKKALSLNIQHLSAYHLTIEPKTVLGLRQRKGLFKQVDENISQSHYDILEKETHDAGFEHYEISNFSKNGLRAIHNSNYWKGIDYLGIGPSAHSFDGKSRRWNIANNTRYIEAMLNNGGEGGFEGENLTLSDHYNEYIMTMLRTIDGVSYDNLKERFGEVYAEYFLKNIEPFVSKGTIIEKDNNFSIRTADFLISDSVISNLFYINEND